MSYRPPTEAGTQTRHIGYTRDSDWADAGCKQPTMQIIAVDASANAFIEISFLAGLSVAGAGLMNLFVTVSE